MTRVVSLEHPEELKESDHTEHTTEMRDTCHDRTEIRAATSEHRACEERDEEERGENDGVEDDGTEGDDGESEKTVDRGRLERLKTVKSAFLPSNRE